MPNILKSEINSPINSGFPFTITKSAVIFQLGQVVYVREGRNQKTALCSGTASGLVQISHSLQLLKVFTLLLRAVI